MSKLQPSLHPRMRVGNVRSGRRTAEHRPTFATGDLDPISGKCRILTYSTTKPPL